MNIYEIFEKFYDGKTCHWFNCPFDYILDHWENGNYSRITHVKIISPFQT